MVILNNYNISLQYCISLFSAKGDKPDHGEELQGVDESSPVIQMFRGFQQELDYRHDKHERIVKLSRDITIESKRAIFLLHRVSK